MERAPRTTPSRRGHRLVSDGSRATIAKGMATGNRTGHPRSFHHVCGAVVPPNTSANPTAPSGGTGRAWPFADAYFAPGRRPSEHEGRIARTPLIGCGVGLRHLSRAPVDLHMVNRTFLESQPGNRHGPVRMRTHGDSYAFVSYLGCSSFRTLARYGDFHAGRCGSVRRCSGNSSHTATALPFVMVTTQGQTSAGSLEQLRGERN